MGPLDKRDPTELCELLHSWEQRTATTSPVHLVLQFQRERPRALYREPPEIIVMPIFLYRCGAMG